MEETGGPSPRALRDRSRALVAFGWILIVVGALCALMALLSASLVLLARAAPGGAPVAFDPRMVLFNVVLYFSLAAAFVTLGIGSIRARRWALALTVVVAWVWLTFGVLGVLAMAVLVPKVFAAGAMAGGTPPGMITCVLVILLLFAALFFIVLPTVVLLFYRREDVRQTVVTRNSDPDWTDRVPLPILGLVLALAFGGFASVLSVPVARAVPVFGAVLKGWPAALVLLFFGAISFLLALGVYRRSMAAWWGLVALQIVGLANIFTFGRLDMETLMRDMGYPPEQARIASQIDLFRNPWFLGLMAAAWLALMVFLLSIRKYFRPAVRA
jgi:uncharacterized membrane protein